jgi:hypothetical protein
MVNKAQRTWVGLTDEEVKDIVWSLPYEPSQEDIRAIRSQIKGEEHMNEPHEEQQMLFMKKFTEFIVSELHWLGLTGEQIIVNAKHCCYDTMALDCAHRIQAKVKEKNT